MTVHLNQPAKNEKIEINHWKKVFLFEMFSNFSCVNNNLYACENKKQLLKEEKPGQRAPKQQQEVFSHTMLVT